MAGVLGASFPHFLNATLPLPFLVFQIHTRRHQLSFFVNMAAEPQSPAITTIDLSAAPMMLHIKKLPTELAADQLAFDDLKTFHSYHHTVVITLDDTGIHTLIAMASSEPVRTIVTTLIVRLAAFDIAIRKDIEVLDHARKVQAAMAGAATCTTEQQFSKTLTRVEEVLQTSRALTLLLGDSQELLDTTRLWRVLTAGSCGCLHLGLGYTSEPRQQGQYYLQRNR
jgi:hypothetical protein